MSGRLIATLLLVAVLLTLATSSIASTRLEVQDWDCPPGPASCARPVEVRGVPFPFISDHHGISVVGRASLAGVLLGEDDFHAKPFAANVGLIWLMLLAAFFLARRQRTAE